MKTINIKYAAMYSGVAGILMLLLSIPLTTLAISLGDLGNITLRMGMGNQYVANMQQTLNLPTCSNAGLVVDGSFGPRTNSAVTRFQVTHGLTVDGLVGPKTKAMLVSCSGNGISPIVALPQSMTMCPIGYAFHPLTGQTCTNVVTTDSGCPSGYVYNPLTGERCAAATLPQSSTTPKGKAGSVEEYRKSSYWNIEAVGEDEKDVTILGLEIRADNDSDLDIVSLRIDFDDEGSANNKTRLDRYLKSVGVWSDGKEYANVDASLFNEDNNYGRTVSLKPGLRIPAGKKITIEITASGVRNLDSASVGDSWNVDIDSVRWKDTQGTIISEDPSISETKFTVESFSTAAQTRFRIRQNGRDSINKSHLIDVDASRATDNVPAFSFDVEIRGTKSVFLDDLTVEATVTGAGHIDEMFDVVKLYVDGGVYRNKKVSSIITPTDDETITFDNLKLTLEGGETYEFTVTVDFLSTNGALDEGDTVAFTISETETDLGRAFTDIRDASGNQLSDENKIGRATSGPHATHDVGIQVKLVGTSTQVITSSGADNDSATFTIMFDVTAYGGTVYIGNTAEATTVQNGSVSPMTTNGFAYRVYDSGTATTDDLTSLIVFTTPTGVVNSGDNIEIRDGRTSRVTLVVTQNNDSPEDDGIYYMDLAGIGWGVVDDTVYEYLYTYNLDEFRTNPVSLN